VLLNLHAGTGTSSDRRVADTIRGCFDAHHVRATVQVMEGRALPDAAHRAIAAGAKVVVAGGGDGTISAVAGAVVGSAATLGVLPIGTLNHFARDLGIPTELEQAVAVVCDGTTRRIDVGRVNEHVFINNSALGLYPQAVRARDRQMQRLGRGKWPAYAWAAWTTLRRHAFLSVRVESDGESIACRTPLVFIGNNSYEFEGLGLGARDRLDAGNLSVFIVKDTGRLGLLGLAFRALAGRLRGSKDFRTFCAQRIEVQTRRREVMVATDGEVTRMTMPLLYRIEPGALAVIVPRTAR
jgi:diacylglycerol kinase family enzyme